MSQVYSTYAHCAAETADSSSGVARFDQPPSDPWRYPSNSNSNTLVGTAAAAAAMEAGGLSGAKEGNIGSISLSQQQQTLPHTYLVTTTGRPDYIEKRPAPKVSVSTSLGASTQPPETAQTRQRYDEGEEEIMQAARSVRPGAASDPYCGDGRSDGGLDDAMNDGTTPETVVTQQQWEVGKGKGLKNTEEDEFNAVERRARIALEAIAVRDEDVESNMPHYVSALRAYRIACEARQMYREAHLVQQVLRNLRLEEETRHVRGLTEQQMEERRTLEESHREEFRTFHRLWNEKIDSFEEAQLEMEITLLERQNDELLRFHEEMRDFDPRGVPRFSRSLLAARQRQQALARQKNYVAAQEAKAKGDAIELGDIDRYEAIRAQMYERREYALRYQHQQELLALRLKVEGRRLLLEKSRKRELDEVLQRYINARNEMEMQQNIIRKKTGAILLKHACNGKTDSSGSAALVESVVSGTFGTVVQRRVAADQQQQQQQLHDSSSSSREQQRTVKDCGASRSPGPGMDSSGSGGRAVGSCATGESSKQTERQVLPSLTSSSATSTGRPGAQRHRTLVAGSGTQGMVAQNRADEY